MLKLFLMVIILAGNMILMSKSHFFLNISYIVPIVILLYFVINIWYLYKYRRNKLFCFELLFALSFFCCSFLTPFVYPMLDSWQSRIFIHSDFIISKTYLVCFLGYCSYLLPLTFQSNIHIEYYSTLKFNNKSVQFTNIITFLFIVLFYIMGGSSLLTLYSSMDTLDSLSNRFSGWGQYLGYAQLAYIISVIINLGSDRIYTKNFISLIKVLPKLFLFNSMLLVVPLLLSGLRSRALEVIIPILMVYGFLIRQLTFKDIALILGITFVVMQIIGLTRTGDSLDSTNISFITYVRDFIPANAANTYLIDYADRHGPTMGGNMILPILSIVPFLQSFYLAIFTDVAIDPMSSSFFTNSFDSWSGLGTGIIGDLYYTFGLIGVLILMFLYGFFLRMMYCSKKRSAFAVLVLLTGNAIFAPRVEYSYMIRTIVWGALLLYIIISLTNNKKGITV